MSQTKCFGCGQLQIVNKKGNRVAHSEDCPFRRMAESIERIEEKVLEENE